MEAPSVHIVTPGNLPDNSPEFTLKTFGEYKKSSFSFFFGSKWKVWVVNCRFGGVFCRFLYLLWLYTCSIALANQMGLSCQLPGNPWGVDSLLQRLSHMGVTISLSFSFPLTLSIHLHLRPRAMDTSTKILSFMMNILVKCVQLSQFWEVSQAPPFWVNVTFSATWTVPSPHW